MSALHSISNLPGPPRLLFEGLASARPAPAGRGRAVAGNDVRRCIVWNPTEEMMR